MSQLTQLRFHVHPSTYSLADILNSLAPLPLHCTCCKTPALNKPKVQTVPNKVNLVGKICTHADWSHQRFMSPSLSLSRNPAMFLHFSPLLQSSRIASSPPLSSSLYLSFSNPHSLLMSSLWFPQNTESLTQELPLLPITESPMNLQVHPHVPPCALLSSWARWTPPTCGGAPPSRTSSKPVSSPFSPLWAIPISMWTCFHYISTFKKVSLDPTLSIVYCPLNSKIPCKSFLHLTIASFSLPIPSPIPGIRALPLLNSNPQFPVLALLCLSEHLTEFIMLSLKPFVYLASGTSQSLGFSPVSVTASSLFLFLSLSSLPASTCWRTQVFSP